MRISLKKALLVPAAALGLAFLAGAQIELLTLEKMVHRSDNAVEGKIIAKQVFRVDDPIDGPDLYYTKLTVKGRSCFSNNACTVDVIYGGGFIDEDEGVWNSEAPTDAETKIGNRVLVFYQWLDNMGGGVSGNTIVASHGGLYSMIRGRSGDVVQGRGLGYAIRNNVKIAQLETDLSRHLATKK